VEKIACLTLDLEPDLRSPDKRVRLLEHPGKLERLLDFLKNSQTPLTCFSVMSLAKHYRDELLALSQRMEIEFAVHSFSHDKKNPASANEIERCWDEFGALFNRTPGGYRSPNCLIDEQGLRRVAKRGFAYDSSIVPSVRLDEYGYNNLSYGRMPFRFNFGEMQLLELPVACMAALRIPFVFSYAKLAGMSIYRALSALMPLPDIAVTYFHPYDLYIEEIADNIPGWKRYAHMRGAHRGFELLSGFASILRDRGYRCAKMSELVEYCNWGKQLADRSGQTLVRSSASSRTENS
jgi:peptidoglycan/xylan/chitin deacetylase (PgdA/CDA1 family)